MHFLHFLFRNPTRRAGSSVTIKAAYQTWKGCAGQRNTGDRCPEGNGHLLAAQVRVRRSASYTRAGPMLDIGRKTLEKTKGKQGAPQGWGWPPQRHTHFPITPAGGWEGVHG